MNPGLQPDAVPTGRLARHLDRLRAETRELARIVDQLDPEETQALTRGLSRADEKELWVRSRLEETRLLLRPEPAEGPSCRGELLIELEDENSPSGWQVHQHGSALHPGQRVRTTGRADRAARIRIYARTRSEDPSLRALSHAPGPRACTTERIIIWELAHQERLGPDAFVRFELQIDAWECGGWGTYGAALRIPCRG